MYKPKIFLVGEGQGDLIALEETGYVTESVLQRLLVDYPDLLPGEQIAPENPRRWLLVAHEMGVPGDVAETGRWSLDHLFLDQDGIPTFVECKRATDTRARREVVAQMLDYAANGVEYWSMDRLRQAASETAQSRGESLDDEIVRLLGEDEDEADVEGYWEYVEANLRNRRVRLVFVADSIHRELRRLVEFLNEEMTNVEVLAVEIKQFQREDDEGQKALVPRVVGFTEAARSAKKHRERKPRITREEFMEKCTPETRRFYQRVLDLAEKRDYIIEWVIVGFSIRARLPNGRLVSFVNNHRSEVRFIFSSYFRHPEEMSTTLRNKLLDFGVFKESGDYTLRAALTEENLALVDEVYDFILDQIDEYIRQKEQGDHSNG